MYPTLGHLRTQHRSLPRGSANHPTQLSWHLTAPQAKCLFTSFVAPPTQRRTASQVDNATDGQLPEERFFPRTPSGPTATTTGPIPDRRAGTRVL